MKRGFKLISINQWLKDGYNEETYKELKLPKRSTSHSAGYDIFSPIDFTLEPNQEIKIPLGFKAYMKEDEFLAFHVRSSIGFKYRTILCNATGIGDSDYFDNEGNEGHYWCALMNLGNKTLEIKAGDHIAQCIFQKYLLADGDNYEGKSRVGGIGSTNKEG